MKTLNALTEDFKAMGLKGGIVEETELLPVIFRKFKKEGDIVALFPTLPGTDDPETCMSYMHVGQHGSASTDLMRIGTAPATPEEYSDLLKELKEIYEPDVKLVVKPRITPEMDRQRIDALRESRKGSGKREVEDKSVGAIAELRQLIQEYKKKFKKIDIAFASTGEKRKEVMYRVWPIWEGDALVWLVEVDEDRNEIGEKFRIPVSDLMEFYTLYDRREKVIYSPLYDIYAESKKGVMEKSGPRQHLREAFSRQHYRAIADILKTISNEGERKEIAEKFAEMFKQDNPQFKPELFLKACGL